MVKIIKTIIIMKMDKQIIILHNTRLLIKRPQRDIERRTKQFGAVDIHNHS